MIYVIAFERLYQIWKNGPNLLKPVFRCQNPQKVLLRLKYMTLMLLICTLL